MAGWGTRAEWKSLWLSLQFQLVLIYMLFAPAPALGYTLTPALAPAVAPTLPLPYFIFLMLQAEERRSVKQKAQAFTSGQSRSRPDSGTVEGCARQPRCTKNPRGSEVERIHTSGKQNG